MKANVGRLARLAALAGALPVMRLAGALPMTRLASALPVTLLVGALLATLGSPAGAQPVSPANAFGRHLEQALALDAEARGLAAQREAAAARLATVRSPIAGSPFVGGDFRGDTRGLREARGLDLELAAPVWLPGQRGALGGSIDAAIAEVEARLPARRLELAGLLRDTWWTAALAIRETRLARDRLATSRDVARDVNRRAELGDIAGADALLAQNELLGAELALLQAQAREAEARGVYRLLTGGEEPELPEEPVLPRPPQHPALAVAERALAAATARARLVAATPRDNPEVGVFGRGEDGSRTEQGVSLGVRVRIPLATDARNVPRRAQAEAEITAATAQLAQRRRLVEAEIAAAGAALRAAEAAARTARARLAVAEQQLGIAQRAFRAGETATFDLLRVRQQQLEAAGNEAQTAIGFRRARSRLNQAMGAVPD